MIKIIKDTNAEYHSSELIGTSTMVSGYDSNTGEINLAKVGAHINDMKEVSKSLQKIFDFGGVQHSAILEQDLSSVVVLEKYEPIPGITAKDQKEAWLAENPDADPKYCPKFAPIAGTTAKDQIEKFKSENPSEFYVSPSEMSEICGAFEVLAESGPAAQMISNALYVETSFYDESEGVKCRPDIVGLTDNNQLYVMNYKTIADLGKINSHIYHLKYELRAQQEIEIVQKAMGKPVDKYFFLFQEKKAPYSMKCLVISQTDLDNAEREYLRIKNTVKIALAENYFPQPEFKIEQTKVYR